MTEVVSQTKAKATEKKRRERPKGFTVVILTVTAVFLGSIVAAEWISPYDPVGLVGPPLSAPSADYWFGTDSLGRDVFSRTLHGGQATLRIAVTAVLVAAAIGVPLGLIAGYFGRIADTVIMRSTDVVLAFPGLLLALVIIAILGTGEFSLILALAISRVPTFIRVVYAETMALRSVDYVAASRLIGASRLRTLRVDIFPSVVRQVIVIFSTVIGWEILIATSLNFLGVGVSPPTPEWGVDLGLASTYIIQAWWITVPSGVAIAITILLSNYLGDIVLDATAKPKPNPVSKHQWRAVSHFSAPARQRPITATEKEDGR